MITPLPAGTTFAGYQIDGVLARGGMGVVYLATQLRPRRTVALKLIAPQYATDPSYRERFLREVDALAALEHPHIVPIYDAGECDGELFLAMRYLDGPDLAAILREEGLLDPGRALLLLGPIADALDAAHAQGIVHRDVTPANIRLDRRGDPYLTDFGLTRKAASQGSLTLASGPIGTPAYMAPEQFAAASQPSDPKLASRIDVYSLGCVLCTCLTGSPPYPRDTYEAALWAHVHEPPPRLTSRRPALPTALDGVLATALAKDAAARYPSAGALVTAARMAAGAGPDERAAEVIVPRRAGTVPLPAAAGPVAAAAGVVASSSAAPAGGAEAPAPPAAGDVAPLRAPGPDVSARSRSSADAPRRSRLLPAAIALVLFVGGAAIVAGLNLGALSRSAGGVGVDPSGTPGVTPAPTRTPRASRAPSPVPTPTPRPTPEPTPTPVPTPTPEPTPRLGTAKNVAKLRAMVPPPVRKSCTSADLGRSAAIAVLRCEADEAGLVMYVLYPDAAARDKAWQQQLSNLGLPSSGSCETGQPHIGTWGTSGFLGFGGETLGRIACWVDERGNARIDWTLDAAPVRHVIRRSDGYLAGLYQTWARDELTVRMRSN